MDRRTTGIIATLVTALFCGCPGLASLCWGGIAAIVSFVPNSNIDIVGSNNPRTALFSGLGALCLGILFIAIPFIVGYFTLREKPEETPISNEPIPPAI
jgi:hypothetical protein